MCDTQNRITFEMRDEYQRKAIAEKIIRLLNSEVTISPLVIDGHWGAGKTEFCRKLIHLIEDDGENLQPIYVDAFKADHADEPLMTLMAAVLNALPEAEREPLIKKALPAIKFGAKTLLKAGVSWGLKQDTAEVVDGFEEEVKKAGDKLINHTVESLLKDHVAVEQNITTLQTALAERAKDAPIVLFIDELDRCRPDFAVNMLENIKHIFDVEGVQFVLVANSEQLRSSIRHCYGELDPQRYLDKFIKFSLVLSDTHKPNGPEAVLASVTHLKRLISESELLDNTNLNADGFSDFLTTLIKANRLSLREVETFVLYLEIYQTLTDKKGLENNVYLGHCLLRLLGIFLYCFKTELSEKVVRGEIVIQKIAEVMGKSELFRQWDSGYPDCADVVTAIAGVEIHDVDGSLSFTEEELQNWQQTFKDFRLNGLGHRARFQEVVTAPIETLKLGR